MSSRNIPLLLISALLALPAGAMERQFPDNVKRGVMTPGPYPTLIIDGQQRQMSPGARIWNQQNLTEVPAELRGSDHPVNYTETEQGAIDRVWILTPSEASRAKQRQPSPFP